MSMPMHVPTELPLDRWLAGWESPDADVRLRTYGLMGEVDYYKAWLYARIPAAADPDCEPDHFVFCRTRDEMIEEIGNLPSELAVEVVVKAMMDGELYPIDQFGNALDPDDLHVIANAV